MHSNRRRHPSRYLALAAGALLAVSLGACSATTGGGATAAPERAVGDPAADGPGVTASEITLSWGPMAYGGLPAEARKGLLAGAKAVTDQMNADGGIAGRTVTIATDDPAATLLTQRQDAYGQSQGLPVPDPTDGKAACDAYAAGSPAVFAVLSSDLVSEPLGTAAAGACLNAAGHPVIGTRNWDAADYRDAPATAGLSTSTERWIAGLIAAADDAGSLTDGTTTALITDSTAPGDDVEKVFLPALEKAGLKDAATYPVNPNATPAELLTTVLKLKSKNVERIIYLAPENGQMIAQGLTTVLQEQAYFPQQLLLDSSPFQPGIAYTDRMLDSIASYVSERDTIGLTPDRYGELPSSAAVTLCAAAAKANPTVANSISLSLCDSLTLLKAAIEAGGGDHVNATAFRDGLNTLGTDFASPLLFGTAFGKDDHSGAAGVTRETFSPDCGCTTTDSDVVAF